jgi:site-specific recombinase XerD
MMPSSPEQEIDDPLSLFESTLGGKDPKTVRTYMSTLRDLVKWLSARPGGSPFRFELLTETAIKGYLDSLVASERAPRTRSKALSAIRRFCRWAVDENRLRRNPAALIPRPVVAALAPTELTDDQRYALKTLVERSESKRLSAIFALAYWAGMRISEIASLRLDQCEINRRAGSVTVLDGKGGKTRVLDLHNEARRALYAFLYEGDGDPDARDPESAFVFTSQRATWLRLQGKPDRLSERGIEHLWASLKKRASHDEWERIRSVTFHDLRHDWAHRARGAGWLLEEIAVYAGHQTKDGAPAVATTARYTLPSRHQLKERLRTLPG